MRRTTRFGAATDDPSVIARRAIREAEVAIRQGDRLGLRQAANKGYLAASSAADVAAVRLGMNEPEGASGRRVALERLERTARVRRGSLLAPFESARRFLHGDCFHGDDCPSDRAILGLLDGVENLTRDVTTTLGRLRRRQ
jgi:hypothetical protein